MTGCLDESGLYTTISFTGDPADVISTPSRTSCFTLPFSSTKNPAFSAPSADGNTMSLSMPEPNELIPFFSQKRPATFSQPDGPFSLSILFACHCSISLTYAGSSASFLGAQQDKVINRQTQIPALISTHVYFQSKNIEPTPIPGAGPTNFLQDHLPRLMMTILRTPSS